MQEYTQLLVPKISAGATAAKVEGRWLALRLHVMHTPTPHTVGTLRQRNRIVAQCSPVRKQ
jgi:hypothetical protein